MTTIQKILKDHRVEEISDERSVGDGFWVYLKVGYYGYEEGSHIIHEDAPTQCFSLLRDSRRCGCDECLKSEEQQKKEEQHGQ